MRRLVLFFSITILTGQFVKAQELNCSVQVITPKLQTADPAIFRTFENAVYEFMNNKLSKNFLSQIHAFNPPKKWFMDIETEVIDGFPDVENPKERVLTNCFCNQSGIVYITTIDPVSEMMKANIITSSSSLMPKKTLECRFMNCFKL